MSRSIPKTYDSFWHVIAAKASEAFPDKKHYLTIITVVSL
jgi:hypothetical protein